MSEATIYERDRTMMVTVPTDKTARVHATKFGETYVRVGAEMVTIYPGEDALIENGRIVAPKRILDERRAELGRRLSAMSGL